VCPTGSYSYSHDHKKGTRTWKSKISKMDKCIQTGKGIGLIFSNDKQICFMKMRQTKTKVIPVDGWHREACQRKITGKLVSVNVPRSRELNRLVDYVTNTCHKVPSQNLWDQRGLQLLSSYLNIVEVLQGIHITISFGVCLLVQSKSWNKQ
jgi:hypothetical protein